MTPTISPADREILRPLAARVAALAARPIEAEKRQLWYDHNALKPTRPLLFCDPENGWNEIFPASSLACQGPTARAWEMHLRKEIFWAESLKDDRVIAPTFPIGYAHTQTDWGLHETRIGGDHGGAYTWDAPLTSYDLFDQLRFPTVTVDYAATQANLDLAHHVLGDLLPPRLQGFWWWTLGMTWTAVNLRGMTQLMLDMYDEPQNLHRLMAFLRDGNLARLNFLESQKLLSANTDAHYIGSGSFGFSHEIPAPIGPATTANMWGFAESQETVGVSPEQFAEFVFPYQKPLLDRFALNCYGCCEPLQTRWHIVKQFPRLRRLSIAPAADLEKMAEGLQGNYIYSIKLQPADLASAHMNEDIVRSRARRALEITKGFPAELIMKDTHTLGNNPRNATRWVEIAREEIAAAGRA